MNTSRRPRRTRSRVVAFALASLLTFTASCSPWRTVPLTSAEIPSAVAPRIGDTPPRIRYRVDGSNAWRMMEVRRVDGPLLVGYTLDGATLEATRVPVTADVRRLTHLTMYAEEIGTARSVGSGIGIALGSIVGVVVIGVVVAFLASSS